MGIDKILQIVKHLADSKRGMCCEKHREVKDHRFARKSVKTLAPTGLANYIRPILNTIQTIMNKNGHVKEIAKYINDLASALTYKSLS